METRKIYDGKADRETTFDLLNRESAQRQNYDGTTRPNPFWQRVKAGDWFEIDEVEYWYFLEVLPPLAMAWGSFSMSEFESGDLTNSFHKIGLDEAARFFCMTIASPEFRGRQSLLDGRRALQLAIAGVHA